MTNQPKMNIDADTIERVFVCEAQKVIAALEKRNASLELLVSAVNPNCGIHCDDVNGVNWFDGRAALDRSE